MFLLNLLIVILAYKKLQLDTQSKHKIRDLNLNIDMALAKCNVI